MQVGYLSYGLLAALAIALLVAAFTDFRHRKIDNWLTAAIALGAPLFWFAMGLSLPEIGWQIGIAIASFAVLAGLFALGAMGGGDVKLLTALALWFPWQAILSLVVLMALLGGVVTLVTVIHHKMTHRLGQPEIPYGVAISHAALWLLPWPTIF